MLPGVTEAVALPASFGGSERKKRPGSFFPFEIKGLGKDGGSSSGSGGVTSGSSTSKAPKLTSMKLAAPTQEEANQWMLWVQAAASMVDRRAPTLVDRRLGRRLSAAEAVRVVWNHAAQRYRETFPGAEVPPQREEKAEEEETAIVGDAGADDGGGASSVRVQGVGSGNRSGSDPDPLSGYDSVGSSPMKSNESRGRGAGGGTDDQGDGDGKGAASASVSAADAEAAQAASQAALARSLPAYPGPYPVPRDAELARMSDESIELMLRLAVEEDGAPGGLWSDNGSADGVKLSASSDAVPGARGTGEVAYPQDAIV